MKIRTRHAWQGPRMLRWGGRRELEDTVDVVVMDRCEVCREKHRVLVIASFEASNDPGIRAWIEEKARASAERSFARAWCYPDPRVRAIVRWLERWRAGWRRFRGRWHMQGEVLS